MAGYSGTPLATKLGIKEGHRVAFPSAPDGFAELLGDLPVDNKVCAIDETWSGLRLVIRLADRPG